MMKANYLVVVIWLLNLLIKARGSDPRLLKEVEDLVFGSHSNDSIAHLLLTDKPK
jgi:hypothetical protein